MKMTWFHAQDAGRLSGWLKNESIISVKQLLYSFSDCMKPLSYSLYYPNFFRAT